MRMCANCHKPIGLTRGVFRYWDWRGLRWWYFHHRDCKREWLHKRSQDIDKERAVRRLFRPP